MPSTIPQNATEKFQKSIGGSIKSLFAPGGRTYFVLEHKTNSEKHRTGESSNFLGDYVEIGRGDKYAVNFGDDCKTVSRPHAAISRNGNGWALTPVSTTNATLVNGKPISGDRPLNNGDEIQLAANGPRFAFLVPSNPSAKTLGFTIRFKAAMNEAVRPYKKAIATIVGLFVLIIFGLSFWGYRKFQSQEELIGKLKSEAQQAIATANAEFQETLDSTRRADSLRLANMPKPKPSPLFPMPPTTCSTSLPYDAFSKNVYFIVSRKLSIEVNGETSESEYKSFVATGFLMEDGTFVTARHVVQPWLFGKSDGDLLLSAAQHKGVKLAMSLTAISPTGDRIELSSDRFTYSSNGLSTANYSYVKESGDSAVLECDRGSLQDGSDWATFKTDRKDGLAFNKIMSSSLPANTNMEVLGYSLGMGANDLNDIKPLQSNCFVSRPGLDKGRILISNRGYDQGNSGGPVFARTPDCKYVVVGIVSAQAGNQGIIIPISAAH